MGWVKTKKKRLPVDPKVPVPARAIIFFFCRWLEQGRVRGCGLCRPSRSRLGYLPPFSLFRRVLRSMYKRGWNGMGWVGIRGWVDVGRQKRWHVFVLTVLHGEWDSLG